MFMCRASRLFLALQGWHCVSDGFDIDLSGPGLLSVWQAAAPYMGQVMAILKHSDINLNIIQTAQGEKVITTLEQVRGV